ncbi:MAG TPA: hypothetical protein VFC82_09170 [Actinomycetaceae bacterium]|nr:hypothetical protein [Actinomycetaceae bacterium]
MTKRPYVVLAVVAALVVILAVVAAIISSSRNEEASDLSTPSGVVHAYIRALHEGDYVGAAALFEPDSRCDATELSMYTLAESLHIRVVEETIHGERATVRMEIEESYGGLFDGAWTHTEIFFLGAEGDSWVLTGAPWPAHYCDVED